MCLVVTKGKWISKNKEPVKGAHFLPTVYRENLPYKWCYFSLPISNRLIDLNEVISGLEKEDLKQVEVNEKSNEDARDIKAIIPEKEVAPTPLFVPVLLHRSKQKFFGMASSTDYNKYLEGLGKRGAVTTALHHLDRTEKFLSTGHVLKEVTLSDRYIKSIKNYTSHYPIMGFTMTVGSERKKNIIDHLYGELFITKTREANYKEKSRYARLMDIGQIAFQAFWKYYVEGVGIARTADYEDTLVRTNFSPQLGYWDLDFDPEDVKDGRKEKMIIRCLTRYLRAYELFEGGELDIKEVLDKMSDHGYYPTLENKYVEIYNLILGGEIDKALSKFRKVEFDPSPYSICNHAASWKPVSTAYNLTMNVKEKEIYYTHGPPCRNRLTIKYKLKD